MKPWSAIGSFRYNKLRSLLVPFFFSSGTLFGMYNLDKKQGNTGLLGRHFWRIENRHEKGALEKCFTWAHLQEYAEFIYLQARSDRQMACPCSLFQAGLDSGRFLRDGRPFPWPTICFRSRLVRTIRPNLGPVSRFIVSQLCCYSAESADFGALKTGSPEGGYISADTYYFSNGVEKKFTDLEAYNLCCVDKRSCDSVFYLYRPSDDCIFYRPPRRRKSFC